MRVPSPSAEIVASAIFLDGESPHDLELARAFGQARGGERARLALELLCERGASAGGHVYLARGPGAQLERLASSLPQPSAAVERFADGVWQQQLEDAEMSAVLTELRWAEETYRPRTFRDLYEAVVLYSVRANPPHVGLAVLRADGDSRTRPSWPTAWLSALAHQLREPARAPAG